MHKSMVGDKQSVRLIKVSVTDQSFSCLIIYLFSYPSIYQFSLGMLPFVSCRHWQPFLKLFSLDETLMKYCNNIHIHVCHVHVCGDVDLSLHACTECVVCMHHSYSCGSFVITNTHKVCNTSAPHSLLECVVPIYHSIAGIHHLQKAFPQHNTSLWPKSLSQTAMYLLGTDPVQLDSFPRSY